MELTDIYNARSIKDAARLKLARWFNKVEKWGGWTTSIRWLTPLRTIMIPYSISLSTEPQMPMLNPSTQKSKPSGTVQGSNGYPFFLYRFMNLCAWGGRGLQLGFTTDPLFCHGREILLADHIPAVRRNVYFCPCYLSWETKAKITKRADTSWEVSALNLYLILKFSGQ